MIAGDFQEKVFVIGLDGATYNLVRDWVGAGKLPNLRRLMEAGVYGHLKTVPNQNSAPAWTSFMTGVNPGKHGIYHFYEKPSDSYQIRYLKGADRCVETIWGILGKCNKKVGVINVPMTYPAEDVNGFIIAGMDAPGVDSDGFTYPADLKKEILDTCKDYVVEPGITGFVARGELDKAIETAMSAIDARTRATCYLMDRYPWDFFMIVYREIDVIQHHFWKYMDSSYPEYDPEQAKCYGDTILKFYNKLDGEVGKLIDRLPPKTAIVILSDHGGAAAERGPDYLNLFLNRTGYLNFIEKNEGATSLINEYKRQLVKKAFSVAYKKTGRRTKEWALRMFPTLRDRIDANRYFAGIDWDKTKVFGEGGRIELWVNLKGREPKGIVEPGADYDEVCESLRKKLYQWHDPKTGKKVVRKVYRREDVYTGKNLEKAPDLLIHFEDNLYVTGIMIVDEEGRKEVLAGGGVNTDLDGMPPVNGAHRDNGMFIMQAPSLRRGLELQGAEIIDLAPTILYLFGEPIHSNMDGHVLIDGFDDSYRMRFPVRFIDDEATIRLSGRDYNSEEAEVIEKRLRDLGYID